MSSKIKHFYSETNVLITGSTGYLGKLLIQKLLRTCDDISGIYLIIRGKKEKTITERSSEIFNDIVFNKLKEENPEFLKKVHIVEGDCSRLGFGLNQSSRMLLVDKINIVFHCAATLSMDAKMKDAVDTNVRGLSELLDLCHEMRYLKSMVFVSTAYSNCTQSIVEEKFYDPPIQYTTLVQLANEVEESVMNDITTGLISKWPNTYCYTKAIAENVLLEKADGLPVGLFRPTIVMPTYFDPVSGWTSNIYGPVGVMLASGLGVLRVFYCEPNTKFDCVPGDLCVNALICCAWEIHQKTQSNASLRQIPVYNYSGGPERNMTWIQLAKNAEGYKYPLKDILWITSLTLTNNRFLFNFLWLFLHIIPGYFLDLLSSLSGQKPRLIKGYQKILKLTQILEFFTTNEWNIKNDNVTNLWNRLSKIDRSLFLFDMDIVDHKKFVQDTCLGIKLYVLKETLDNAEAERQKYERLSKIHYTVKYTFIFILLMMCYKLIKWSVGYCCSIFI